MKRINENQKITLTLGQLRKLVKESSDDSLLDEYYDKLDRIKAQCEQLMIYLKKGQEALNQPQRTAYGQGDIDIFNSLQSRFSIECEKMAQFVKDNKIEL